MAEVTWATTDISQGFRGNAVKTAAPAVGRALLVLTSSYVATSHVNATWFRTVGVWVKYVKGDETTVEVQVDLSDDGGTTWIPWVDTAAPSSGKSAVTQRTWQLTPANFAATDWVELRDLNNAPLYVGAATALRARAKATGGTPTGTLEIKFTGGI